MSGISLEKHHALSSSHNIKELFNPTLHSIGIAYFSYIKICNDNCSRELLINNPARHTGVAYAIQRHRKKKNNEQKSINK